MSPVQSTYAAHGEFIIVTDDDQVLKLTLFQAGFCMLDCSQRASDSPADSSQLAAAVSENAAQYFFPTNKTKGRKNNKKRELITMHRQLVTVKILNGNVT